ncbi:hypothetical protein OPV22_026750 [Ensete ventricosum]|uniref:VQ domain-containing protein n=1 Tax=Ensete ventricosum TaxID=4639 RepID=A0AAV8PTB2_ENSVE|nr:hypothetical protein OPV22_026750 [Ensete ventricosum]RWV77033.1 hypothetical protein GW17_00062196 [Ensete ventricosum]RWW61464.1 hypothetical protein BHE74_00031478 [Ensete ventricosum]RZR94626.1 hypothetical protein BHM03_00023370 [Ensete ventricosum]
MDSSHSGSIQSSSSGDNEEDDSRGESISSFLNLPPPAPTTAATALQHHHPSSSSSSIFDPLSAYLASFPFSTPESNSLDLDSTWPKGIASSSLSFYPTSTTPGAMTVARPSASASTSPSSVQPQVQADRPTVAPRASKKRSRASRRAPTTVLATDTSNFRDMVQQFTGFPTPPFTSSPFPRPRLDLFSMAAAAAVPPYLLRPFPQKTQAAAFPPMPSSSSALEAIASFARGTLSGINLPITATATSSSSSSTSSSAGKCQLSIVDARPSKPSLDMQSANLVSQPLRQSQAAPKINSHALSAFGAAPHGTPDYTLGGLGCLIATEGTKSTDRVHALSGWVGESAQENAEQAGLKAVIRNYRNQD